MKINHVETSRMCGGFNPVGVALVLPPNVDLRRGKSIFALSDGFEPRSHFARTARHARKLTHGRSERGLFGAHLDESTLWEPGVKERDRKIINPKAAKYAHENLRVIRRQSEPESPTYVTPDALPITILCPRDGCNRISIVRTTAAGAMAKRIETREKQVFADY